jgi:hypothetical protein
MSKKTPLEQLLRWRLKQAEAGAPPPPKAAQLLQSARPWWEKRPKDFRSQMGHLRKFQSANSHAATNKRRKGNGILVPALLVCKEVESENYALVTHLNLLETKLRLRFKLETKLPSVEQNLEVTFISNATLTPMFYVTTTVLADNTFQIDTELPVEIAKDWEQLKLTDPMPFGLIIHSNLEA